MDVLNELCEFFKWKAASCEDEAKSWLALAAKLDPKPTVKESTISLPCNAPAPCVKMTYSQIACKRGVTGESICSLAREKKWSIDKSGKYHLVYMTPNVIKDLNSRFPEIRDDEIIVSMSDLVNMTKQSSAYLILRMNKEGVKRHGASNRGKYTFQRNFLPVFVQKYKKS